MATAYKPYESVWAALTKKQVQVRPQNTGTRSDPGNVTFGTLRERLTEETAERTKKEAADHLAAGKREWEYQNRRALRGSAPPPSVHGPALPDAPMWVGKGDGTSGVRVQVTGRDNLDRMLRRGYTLLPEQQTAGEIKTFRGEARVDPTKASGVPEAPQSPGGITWTGPDGASRNTRAIQEAERTPEGVTWTRKDGVSSGWIKDSPAVTAERTDASGRTTRYQAPGGGTDPYAVARLPERGATEAVVTRNKERKSIFDESVSRFGIRSLSSDAPYSTPLDVIRELAAGQQKLYADAVARRVAEENQRFDEGLERDTRDELSRMSPRSRKVLGGVHAAERSSGGAFDPDAALRGYLSIVRRRR